MHNIKEKTSSVAHYTIILNKIAIVYNNSKNEHEHVKGTTQNLSID